MHQMGNCLYWKSVYFEREENKPNNNMVLMLRFLDGQFADVLDKELHKSEALGWTQTAEIIMGNVWRISPLWAKCGNPWGSRAQNRGL